MILTDGPQNKRVEVLPGGFRGLYFPTADVRERRPDPIVLLPGRAFGVTPEMTVFQPERSNSGQSACRVRATGVASSRVNITAGNIEETPYQGGRTLPTLPLFGQRTQSRP